MNTCTFDVYQRGGECGEPATVWFHSKLTHHLLPRCHLHGSILKSSQVMLNWQILTEEEASVYWVMGQ
jgi:hypothetical protein